MPTTTRARATGQTALTAAALLGLVHAAFSLYWALGGHLLVSTLGTQLLALFGTMRWALIPVALVKGGFAMLPLLLAWSAWRWRPWSRVVCWLGAGVLVAWGGVNTVVGNLVLAGVIRPDGGYDRPGMIGHAWLWDPLFLLWGLSLVAGLVASRRALRPHVRTTAIGPSSAVGGSN